MSPAEKVLTETVGRLIEFWGFGRNMGRVWALLYLSPDPLSARDIRDKLDLSAGAVSMTVTDLGRWGVVRRIWLQGERKAHYVAEVNLWRMVSRVLSERERTEIVVAIEGFQEAFDLLEESRRRAGAHDRKRTVVMAEQALRIRQLLELAKLGRSLLDALLATSKIDAGPLTRFLLRAK